MENKKVRIPTIFKVAGVSFNKKNVDSLEDNQVLILELDSENQYDKNAIKIKTKSDKMIGFVPKEFNEAIEKKFEKISNKYTLKVKNIHKWDGPTGIEVEFTKGS